MNVKSGVRLGQLLIKKGIITSQQLEVALKEQEKTQELLGLTLLRLGFVDEEKVYLPILAQQLGLDFVDLKERKIAPEAIQQIPAKFVYHYKTIPVAYDGETLTIALSKPFDIHILDGVALIVKAKIKSVLASEKDIMEAVRKYYGLGAETIEKIMDTVDVRKKTEVSVAENIEEIGSEASVGTFVNQIFLEAYKDRATDIHIEPFEDELSVRYRIDGLLYDAKVPGDIKYFKDSIISRIKIMSNLDIAERRLPQDGRFKLKVRDIDLDLRVSFLPTPYGESVVIRILNAAKLYSLIELGLSTHDFKILGELLKKPHGIIFVTGPTGSGKTTTLYSCLSCIKSTEKKIITIEDPIEYQLHGITQMQINPHIGLSFSAGLRSMLRHDPDIMMVGEVRDSETAKIAVQIALTGHLIFSTLHTNDAASGINRLLDMGADPYLVSSSVECFIAQRLVRQICSKCKAPVELKEDIIKEFDEHGHEDYNFEIFEGKGCEYCKFTGYHGRQAIFEILVLNAEIRDMILRCVSATQIKNKAIESGMKTLRQDGWEKVKNGVTTPSEVIRVTQEETN